MIPPTFIICGLVKLVVDMAVAVLDSVDEVGKSDGNEILNEVVDFPTAPELVTDENSEDDENVTAAEELPAAAEIGSFVKELDV